MAGDHCRPEQGRTSVRSSLAAVRDTPRYTYLVAAMAGASAATVANWSANLLITVTFLSLINAVGKS